MHRLKSKISIFLIFIILSLNLFSFSVFASDYLLTETKGNLNRLYNDGVLTVSDNFNNVIFDNDLDTYFPLVQYEKYYVYFNKPITITGWYLNSSNPLTLMFYLDGKSVGNHTSFSNNLTSEITLDSMYFMTNKNNVNFYEFDLNIVDKSPQFLHFQPSPDSTNFNILDSVIATFDKVVTGADVTFLDINNKKVNFNITGFDTTTLRITPTSPLAFETMYFVSVSKIAGVDGNVNMSTFSTNFTTMVDNSPVKLLSVIPPPGSTDIKPDISKCVLEFNKPNIDLTTFNTDNIFVTDDVDNIISGTLSHEIQGGKFIGTLNLPLLSYDKNYYINVKDIYDTNNNPLETSYKFKFTTATDPNTLKILRYRPVNYDIVSVNRKIEVVFNKPITLDDLDYILTDSNGNSLSCVPQIMGDTLYITTSLEYGTYYNFDLLKVKSTDGQILENALSINFRTMENTNNNFLNSLLGSMLDVFDNAKSYGLHIVLGAIALGIIFIVALWLWNKTKKWLNRT